MTPLRVRGARNLEHQSDEVYFPHIIKLMGLQDALATEPAVTAIEGANRFYAAMEKRLESEWLAGSYSFADIAFYMAALFGERQSAPLTASTPRLLAWRERMGQRAPVKTVVSAMAAWLKNAGRPVPTFMACTFRRHNSGNIVRASAHCPSSRGKKPCPERFALLQIAPGS